MKKILMFILCILMIENLTACSSQKEEVVGGYEKADSPVITEEIKSICDRALEDKEYEPVVYLESQVVSGTNYCLLLKGENTYFVGYFYEDLDGNAECLELNDTSVETNLYDGLGSWTQPDTCEMSEEATQVFDKAFDSKKTAIALLSTQVVSGTNYCILCEDGAEYQIVYIYEDLDGNVNVTDTKTIEL